MFDASITHYLEVNFLPRTACMHYSINRSVYFEGESFCNNLIESGVGLFLRGLFLAKCTSICFAGIIKLRKHAPQTFCTVLHFMLVQCACCIFSHSVYRDDVCVCGCGCEDGASVGV